ncbi:MAG: hypothetical protein AB1631_19245, partial [Acidobacteriota bacterium]
MKDRTESKEETAPGFFETRRRLIQLPACLAAGAIAGRAEKIFANNNGETGSAICQIARPEGAKFEGAQAVGLRHSSEEKPMADPMTGDMDWESFLRECLPTAEELHKDSTARGQDAYLHWLAFMIGRVRAAEIPRAKLGRFGKLEPAVHFGVEYRGKPFFIVEWWLEPGAVLPPHCHPNVSVCTLGLEGEARIRNFEVVGKAPQFESRETFLVRETHNEIISAGRINTLSALRDNIHTFQAGRAGARGIDLSTY